MRKVIRAVSLAAAASALAGCGPLREPCDTIRPAHRYDHPWRGNAKDVNLRPTSSTPGRARVGDRRSRQRERMVNAVDRTRAARAPAPGAATGGQSMPTPSAAARRPPAQQLRAAHCRSESLGTIAFAWTQLVGGDFGHTTAFPCASS